MIAWGVKSLQCNKQTNLLTYIYKLVLVPAIVEYFLDLFAKLSFFCT